MNSPNENAEVADRFGEVAQRFCAIVDSAPGLDRTEFLLQIYRVLPELIGEAIRLPPLGPSDDQNPVAGSSTAATAGNSRMGYQQWSALYDQLKEKLGDWDLYWEVFDPTKDNEAIHGTLADDIADIYRDLKEGLILNQDHQDTAENIVWEWRFSFYCNWGKHAIDALRTIHFRIEDTPY